MKRTIDASNELRSRSSQVTGRSDSGYYQTHIDFAAVFETTASTVMTFVLAMVLHPDVQLKAQKEVDLVVGPDRLPEFSDMPNLTLISAIVKEVLRSVFSPLSSECFHVYYQVEPCPTSRSASCDK